MAPPLQRVIKRYANRKLYDTRDSRYVTLLEVAALIRAGQDVRVIDNGTKEDKTDVTLALILSEELKARPRGIPRATLKALVRSRGTQHSASVENSMTERATLPQPEGPTPAGEAAAKALSPLLGSHNAFEQAVDARIREILPDFNQLRNLQAEVKRIAGQLADLERRLSDVPRMPHKTSE
jgi:polyhydroxyalkanoate synthesis repressor PhaR